MKHEAIFFDLDDTLYDRSVPYQAAFTRFFGGKYQDKAMQAFDAVIHRGYEVFVAAHTGKITMDEMHIYRHQTGLRDVGIAITPEQALKMQTLYAEAQCHITLSATMRAMLNLCRERFCAIGVITNGGEASQWGKLNSLGITAWVRPELIFISDVCGVMKPAPEIFHLAERAAGAPCVYVGDSYSQDVTGAAACGWRTVWLNRRGEAPAGAPPTATVQSEAALLAFLQSLPE